MPAEFWECQGATVAEEVPVCTSGVVAVDGGKLG